MIKKLSPQEKKALSYAKDRRNSYGESDKASRKSIPLRKRLVNRANRHQIDQDLSGAVGELDLEVADAAETEALGKIPKTWKKWPDQPLGDVIQRQHRRREELGMTTEAPSVE